MNDYHKTFPGMRCGEIWAAVGMQTGADLRKLHKVVDTKDHDPLFLSLR